MGEILRVEELKKYFKVKKGLLHAVDGVSFSIEKGKTLGIVGESGCGKSTLGRLLVHLLESTDGKIIFDGRDVTHISRQELSRLRKETQMIFQDPFSSLNPRMTVYQTLEEPLLIAGKKKNEVDSLVYEMMDIVGLDRRFVNTYPHELDGGRRQRIGIGRALILNPEFIVCDEPVSALDVSIQAQIINLLLDVQAERKLTYIFITHDLSVVRYISDDIMVMYLGQAIEKASKEELFKYPLHPYSQGLLAAAPVPNVDHVRKRVVIQGELTSPINPKPGCRFAARCPEAKEECRKSTPQLTEVRKGHFVACHCVKQISNCNC